MKKTLYDDFNYDLDELREDLAEANDVDASEISDDRLYNYLRDLLDDDLRCIKDVIEYYYKGKTFVVIANLGLWNGRRSGHLITKNIDKVFQCLEDYNVIYSEDGVFKIEATHHDGTNYLEVKLLTDEGEEYCEEHDEDLNEDTLSPYLEDLNIEKYF